MHVPQLLLTVALAAAFVPAAAHAEVVVAHGTAYLPTPVERAHRINLVGKIGDDGGEGEVRLDPNTCGLNDFGDPTFCTLIGVIPQPVEFEPVDAKDMTKSGRKLYAVTGAKLKVKLFLVVPGPDGGSFRLVVRDGEKVTHVLNLAPIPKPGGGE